MPRKVAIVDYGMGNLHSVRRALSAACEGQDAIAEVTRDPNVVAEADAIVVPGQGAFKDSMAALARHDLEAPIRAQIEADRPFLGICLGLQILFEQSEEHGPVDGLGILPGKVRRFPAGRPGIKVPHMGWNRVDFQATSKLPASPQAWFYFVHSYYVDSDDAAVVAGMTTHGEVQFCAAVERGRLFASQFHPEKSQRAGQALLGRFIASL